MLSISCFISLWLPAQDLKCGHDRCQDRGVPAAGGAGHRTGAGSRPAAAGTAAAGNLEEGNKASAPAASNPEADLRPQAGAAPRPTCAPPLPGGQRLASQQTLGRQALQQRCLIEQAPPLQRSGAHNAQYSALTSTPLSYASCQAWQRQRPALCLQDRPPKTTCAQCKAPGGAPC